MVAPVILSVVAFVAGHPTSVVCDASLGGHQIGSAIGWTAYGGNTMYVVPRVCDAATAPLGSDDFALAIGTFIHEASHARGVRSESCAEMTADVGVFDVLRRFYNVPFFSSMSRRVGDQLLAQTRKLPAEYQPETCWRAGALS